MWLTFEGSNIRHANVTQTGNRNCRASRNRKPTAVTPTISGRDGVSLKRINIGAQLEIVFHFMEAVIPSKDICML